MPIGLDALVLVALVVARMPWLGESLGWDVAPALLVVCVAYFAADVFLRARGRDSSRLKLALLALVIAAYVIVPSVRLIVLRHASAPWTFAHDNVIQTEAAVKFLLHGKNPYAATYFDTPLYRWDPQNPALYHYLNLPFQLVVALPVYWIDLRIAYIAFFVLTLLLLWKLSDRREAGLILLAFVALDPLFTRGQVEGRNDIVPMLALSTAIWLQSIDRPRIAALALGCFFASKHTAWLYIPFYIADCESPIRESIKKTWPAWLLFGVLVLPFFVWDPIAFYRSVFGYASGTVAHSYPIRGEGAYGFATWVLSWRWVASDQAYYPFWIFQLAFGLPVMLACLRWHRRERSRLSLFGGYALTLFAFQFFTRYFNQNHVAFILFILALAVLLPKRARIADA